MGRPRKGNRRVVIYLPPALHDRLALVAARRKQFRSDVAVQGLELALSMSDELVESLFEESELRSMTPAEIIAEAMSNRVFLNRELL